MVTVMVMMLLPLVCMIVESSDSIQPALKPIPHGISKLSSLLLFWDASLHLR